jgi:hypothetical protein
MVGLLGRVSKKLVILKMEVALFSGMSVRVDQDKRHFAPRDAILHNNAAVAVIIISSGVINLNKYILSLNGNFQEKIQPSNEIVINVP